MAEAVYALREQVKAALDIAETARSNAQVDRAIRSASRGVEGLTHRKFYPQLATRYFDWPSRNGGRSYRLWLDADELVEVDTLTSGGVVIPAADYFLEPANSGPPFTHVEVDLDSASAFQAGNTHQRAIAITGLFAGCDNVEEEVGELTDTLAADATDEAALSWTAPEDVGVGSILRIDDERVIVTGRTFVDTTQNLGDPLTASAADTTVQVTTGSSFYVGEVILLDAEKMFVVDIAGNNLIVKRAWDGSVLATHATPDIYGLVGVQLARAQLGTTIAEHVATDLVYRYVVPSLINDLCVAEAINQIQQEQSGYARAVGTGENEREVSGRGLREIRAEVVARFGRKARSRAV